MGEVFAQHIRIVNVNKLEMEGKLVYFFLVWFSLFDRNYVATTLRLNHLFTVN